MKIKKAVPTFKTIRRCGPGIFSASRLNPPGGDDCTHVIIRRDGTLGWCCADGTQLEDCNGNVSRFTVDDLLSDDD